MCRRGSSPVLAKHSRKIAIAKELDWCSGDLIMDEKDGIRTNISAEQSVRVVNGKELDRAYWYLQERAPETRVESADDGRRLRRKIDWCIVPIMFCCYTMQFIDKVLLNVSSSALLFFRRMGCGGMSRLIRWAVQCSMRPSWG